MFVRIVRMRIWAKWLAIDHDPEKENKGRLQQSERRKTTEQISFAFIS